MRTELKVFKCANPSCGKDLVQLPGKRKKEYCNSTCRSGVWHRKNRKAEKEAAAPKTEPKKKVARKVAVPKKQAVSKAVASVPVKSGGSSYLEQRRGLKLK